MRGRGGDDLTTTILNRISSNTAFLLLRLKILALRWWLYLAAALVLSLVAAAGLIYWKASRALMTAKDSVRSEQELRFIVRRLPPPIETSFSSISAPAAFSNAAVFQGNVFVCGAAGLFEYDQHGKLLKQYRAGQDLPPTPLLRMTQGVLADGQEPELLITTASEGVLAFDGRSFRQIRPEDAEDRDITAILPLGPGQLLLGTRKRGVLVYNGKVLRRFHPSLAALHVTELAGTATNLWIGTQDQGVVHWSAGRAESFSETQSLPDPQVFSIAISGDQVYVGTALGVAEFDGGRFKRVIAPGTFARTLYVSDAKLLVGGVDKDQGLIEINLALQRLGATQGQGLQSSITDIQQILWGGDSLLAVTSGNLYARGSQGWRPVLSLEGSLLKDRNISSLALDDSGHIWVGYFDHGLDILGSDLLGSSLKNVRSTNVRHIEDEHVFCVNRILAHAPENTVAVATANGLVLFDQLGRQQQVLGRAQGLLADHVTDVAPYGNGLVLATPAGLTFLDASGPRSLYAFQGLVNNHVYAVAASGREVIAGTLGGISVLENESVVSNFTVATPGLKHNWISAVAPAGQDWMIGTYGGGIVRLASTGARRFEDFEIATGNFEVYPNAMLTTDHHILAGTMGKGLYSYNRSNNRWTVITQGLPSLTVTALAAGNGTIYVGTDNGLVRILEQNLP
jgi:ligand-binding sensor domain-containing protein